MDKVASIGVRDVTASYQRCRTDGHRGMSTHKIPVRTRRPAPRSGGSAVRQHSTWGRRSFAALLASGVAMGAASVTGMNPAHADPLPTPVLAPVTQAGSDTVKADNADTLGTKD